MDKVKWVTPNELLERVQELERLTWELKVRNECVHCLQGHAVIHKHIPYEKPNELMVTNG